MVDSLNWILKLTCQLALEASHSAHAIHDSQHLNEILFQFSIEFKLVWCFKTMMIIIDNPPSKIAEYISI